MIIFQEYIKRSDLKNNRNILYLFGDNLKRKGMGGQAKEMRGEPNAIGISTKKEPSLNENAFYSDLEYEANISQIDKDFECVIDHLNNNGIVVCPSNGLGTGLSQLKERAPRTNEYLRNKIIMCRKINASSI